ncbi:hypothetical protein [Clostridium sp. CF012]|uniref:hypothetical protein n=1 Tax=Clostridium sp. CF012 TaxID=2843319 RepID=UPI001C0D6AEB|nr:hypothetical protein [Clostridium sp. CF012]MBU3146924.1 hypothetical protein [Clostridium sp. CF012]
MYTLFWDGTNFIQLGEGGDYGTATADKVLSGSTIGTENGIVAGTIPNFAGSSHDSASVANYGNGDVAVYLANGGYYPPGIASSGGGEVKIPVAQSGLVASKILSGQSVFGLAGTATVESLGGVYVNPTSGDSVMVQNTILYKTPYTTVEYTRIGSTWRINYNGVIRFKLKMSSYYNCPVSFYVAKERQYTSRTVIESTRTVVSTSTAVLYSFDIPCVAGDIFSVWGCSFKAESNSILELTMTYMAMCCSNAITDQVSIVYV